MDQKCTCLSNDCSTDVYDEPGKVLCYCGHDGGGCVVQVCMSTKTCPPTEYGCADIILLTIDNDEENNSTKKMAEHDLSKTIIPYLDRHLAFPLLARLSETLLFPVEQVQAAQYELAKGTNMVDYAVSLFEQLQPDEEIPQGLFTSGHVRFFCPQSAPL